LDTLARTRSSALQRVSLELGLGAALLYGLNM